MRIRLGRARGLMVGRALAGGGGTKPSTVADGDEDGRIRQLPPSRSSRDRTSGILATQQVSGGPQPLGLAAEFHDGDPVDRELEAEAWLEALGIDQGERRTALQALTDESRAAQASTEDADESP